MAAARPPVRPREQGASSKSSACDVRPEMDGALNVLVGFVECLRARLAEDGFQMPRACRQGSAAYVAVRRSIARSEPENLDSQDAEEDPVQPKQLLGKLGRFPFGIAPSKPAFTTF